MSDPHQHAATPGLSTPTASAMRPPAASRTLVPVRVLVVDDSVVMREMLARMLEADERLDVVGTASDAYTARREIKSLKPDVVTLDVQMPEMDGIQFLRNLMRLHPMPVVMVSAFTTKGADVTLQALELGALDFVGKPSALGGTDLNVYARDLAEKVFVAAKARLQPAREVPLPVKLEPTLSRRPVSIKGEASRRLIGIGASTGGPQALRELLQSMRDDLPGMVVVQHIPSAFGSALAARLNSISTVTVKQVEDGDLVCNGHVYLAAGEKHVRVVARSGRFHCVLDDGPPVNHHKPSVDVLFHSMAATAPDNTAAALLTGMGADGAAGLGALRSAGAVTVAQSEASSAVWGMPREAVHRGAATHVVDLDELPALLLRFSRTESPSRYQSHPSTSVSVP